MSDNIDKKVTELIRKHGIVSVVKAVITACDSSADFAHLCNDKRMEEYWRRAAVAVFDSIKCIGDYPEKSKKY